MSMEFRKFPLMDAITSEPTVPIPHKKDGGRSFFSKIREAIIKGIGTKEEKARIAHIFFETGKTPDSPSTQIFP